MHSIKHKIRAQSAMFQSQFILVSFLIDVWILNAALQVCSV